METREEWRIRVRAELERFAKEDPVGYCQMEWPDARCWSDHDCTGCVPYLPEPPSLELLDKLEAEERN